MTTLTVTTPGTITSTPSKPVRMVLRSIDNKMVMNFPIAPVEVTYTGFGWTWAEVPRDGRHPYLVKEAYQLPTMEFTAKLVYSREPDRSVEPLMVILKNMKQATTILTMKYGGWFDARLWRIDELEFKTVRRSPLNNSPTSVEASITLKNVSDIKLTVGPISGGKKTTTKKPSTTKKPAKKSTTKKYKVKKGDTLYKLANRFYNDPGKWRYLADLNKIKNPKKLKVGSTIKY